MPFATVRFKAWPECSIFPCCSAGSVSLIVSCLLETVCTGGKVSCLLAKWAMTVSPSELLTYPQPWILYISGILVLFFLTSLGLRVNCEALILCSYCLLRKKENLNFAKFGFLHYCNMFHCSVDTLNRLMSRLWPFSFTVVVIVHIQFVLKMRAVG